MDCKNNGLHQMIKETIHYLDTYCSCINLIFTSQPNLMIDSGVHSALCPNCHHHIVNAKFSLQVTTSRPIGLAT